MKIIICLDNNNGLMFNNRRQSRDSKIIENIFEIIGSANLYINDFPLIFLLTEMLLSVMIFWKNVKKMIIVL